MALAISDTGFLTSLFIVWLNSWRILETSSLTCPFVMYIGQVTCFLSVWLIVAFTMERFIVVRYPLLRSSVCTASRAKKIIGLLTLLSLLLFSYVWYIARVIEFPLGPQFTQELGRNTSWLVEHDFLNATWIENILKPNCETYFLMNVSKENEQDFEINGDDFFPVNFNETQVLTLCQYFLGKLCM